PVQAHHDGASRIEGLAQNPFPPRKVKREIGHELCGLVAGRESGRLVDRHARLADLDYHKEHGPCPWWIEADGPRRQCEVGLRSAEKTGSSSGNVSSDSC